MFQRAAALCDILGASDVNNTNGVCLYECLCVEKIANIQPAAIIIPNMLCWLVVARGSSLVCAREVCIGVFLRLYKMRLKSAFLRDPQAFMHARVSVEAHLIPRKRSRILATGSSLYVRYALW